LNPRAQCWRGTLLPNPGVHPSKFFTLSRRQCYSWGGCKGSTLTLRPRPASVTTGTRPASVKPSSATQQRRNHARTRQMNIRIRSRTPELPGTNVFPIPNGVFHPKYAAHTSPQALPVFQETNGRVWLRVWPNLPTPSIRLRGTLKDTTPRVDYLSR
jgi:hypothetical protein